MIESFKIFIIIFGVKIKLLMLKIVDRKKMFMWLIEKLFIIVLFEVLFNFKLVIFWNYIKMDLFIS